MSKLRSFFRHLFNNPSYIINALLVRYGQFLPDKPYLSLRYRCHMGHWMSWKHPKTFTEKIQWLKVYDFKPWYTQLVDKLAVKEYVAERIGKEYVIPTFAVWNSVSDINWDSLPLKFVLKTTHGGGGGGVVVCRDKYSFNKEKAIEKLKLSMRTNAGYSFREKPYIRVPRKIIAERLMEEYDSYGRPIGKDLPDYKFFCFDGEPQYCQVIRDRHTKETIDFYDMEWKHMPFVGLNPYDTDGARNGSSPVEKPQHLELLKSICRKLSKNLKFSRIDLYVIDNKEYFGEITFYPASGFGFFDPSDWDKKLGDLIDLQRKTLGGGKITIGDDAKSFHVYAENDNELNDYKFFCFGGQCKFFKVDFGRFVEHHANYYSPDGKLLPFGEKGLEPDPNHELNLPSNLKDMIAIAEKLSAGFRFLRVDLYNVSGKIFFGELTFYPASGLGPFVPEEWDEKIGMMLQLN